MNKQLTTKIFQILSNGGFIACDSRRDDRASLFEYLDENFQFCREYFEGVGFYLERGVGYFYFSMDDTDTDIKRKYTFWLDWIDTFNFLKLFDQNFGCGSRFTPAQLTTKINMQLDLQSEAKKMFKNKSHSEVADAIVNELKKRDFIELVDDIDESYVVTSAFHYIEDFINLAEDQNHGEEISE